MKYRVTEITGAKEVEGRSGKQIRTSFKVEGLNYTLSTFHDKALSVGQEIVGNVKDNTKDGKTYHNFYFDDAPAPKSVSPAPDTRMAQMHLTLDKIDFKLDSIIRSLKLDFEHKAGNFKEGTSEEVKINENSSSMSKAFEELEVDPDNIPF